MSDGELRRLELLRDLDQRRLTVETTAQLLGLERRQVFRLLKAYRSEGATGLISRRRGTLLVFIDDATSRLMHLQFVESESTFAYFHCGPRSSNHQCSQPSICTSSPTHSRRWRG
jgi:hypothetical protein